MRFATISPVVFAIHAAAQSITTSTGSAASATSSANVTTIDTANRIDGNFNATVWALIVSRTVTKT
jgi:hypothetical protein